MTAEPRARILDRFRAMIDRSRADKSWRSRDRAVSEVRGGRRSTSSSSTTPVGTASPDSGSLATCGTGNANEIVVDIGSSRSCPSSTSTPVLAGVNGTDPFMLPNMLLPKLHNLGFAGVQNFPTVGLIDGVFRNLEETGMGYGVEVRDDPAGRRASTC